MDLNYQIIKFVWKKKGSRIAKSILKKKNEDEWRNSFTKYLIVMSGNSNECSMDLAQG